MDEFRKTLENRVSDRGSTENKLDKYVLVLDGTSCIVEGENKMDAVKRYLNRFRFGFDMGKVFECRIESLRNLQPCKVESLDTDMSQTGVRSMG